MLLSGLLVKFSLYPCREMEIGNVAFSFNMGRAYASPNSLIVLLRAITQREVISCLVLSRQTLISVRGRRGDRERWTNRACRSCTLSSCRRTFQLIVDINTVVSPSHYRRPKQCDIFWDGQRLIFIKTHTHTHYTHSNTHYTYYI